MQALVRIDRSERSDGGAAPTCVDVAMSRRLLVGARWRELQQRRETIVGRFGLGEPDAVSHGAPSRTAFSRGDAEPAGELLSGSSGLSSGALPLSIHAIKVFGGSVEKIFPPTRSRSGRRSLFTSCVIRVRVVWDAIQYVSEARAALRVSA